MIVIDAADMRIANRMASRYEKIYGRMRAAQKAAQNDRLQDIVLDGYGVLYNEPLVYENEIWIFEPGCFSQSLNSGREIHFQIDHDDNERVASTRNALSLVDSEVGLAFRLALSDVERGEELLEMVETGKRSAISIGIRNEDTHFRMFGEHPVRIITKAELVEISQVGAGKCQNAFVGVVRTDFEALGSGKKGAWFTLNFVAHKMKRLKAASNNRSDAIASIANRLAQIEGKRPIAKTEAKAKSAAERWYRDRCADIAEESPAVATWYKKWAAS